MFPHTITIYHYEEIAGADKITRQVVEGVYWYGGIGSASNGKGATEEDTATIVTSPERAQDYGSAWTIYRRDRVIKGVGAEVKSLKEIPAGITVLRIDENICGSAVDNITITGR